MTHRSDSISMSSRRNRLISYEAAYAVALAARTASGARHFILRTDNPLQPYRVTSEWPRDASRVLALVA